MPNPAVVDGPSPTASAGRFARRYGTGPWHLLLMVACFTLAGYVASLIASVEQGWRIAVWFLGAAIFHDLVLWPLYALADRIGLRWGRRSKPQSCRRPSASGPRPAIPLANHLRVPTVISGVLLVVSFPLVLHMAHSYRPAVGLEPSPYTVRWLLVTACLYGGSALVYLARLGWAHRRAGTGG